MFRTDRLAVWHLPKTGGSQVRHWLQDYARGHSVGNAHTPVWHTRAAEVGDRLRVGTWRDPAAWYASLYSCAGKGLPEGHHGDLRMWSGGPRVLATFRDCLYGWTHPRERNLTDIGALGVIWSPIHARPEHLQASGLGLASWACKHHYGLGPPGYSFRRPWPDGWSVDALVDTSRLHEGWCALVGRDLPDARDNTRAARKGTREWDGMPGDYRDWYDDDMLGWVREADGWLLEQQGRDVFETAPQAVTWVGEYDAWKDPTVPKFYSAGAA